MARERKSLIETGSILPGPDILSRVIARDRDQSGRQAPPLQAVELSTESDDPPSRLPTNPLGGDSSIIGNMIGNTRDYISDGTIGCSSDQPYDSPVIQSSDKVDMRSDRGQSELEDEPPSLLSAAKSIRQSFVTPTVRVRYNAVTFKIHPGMEEWVNDHVRKTGRMKQDVLNDALTLYRNLVEEVLPEPQSGRRSAAEKGRGGKK